MGQVIGTTFGFCVARAQSDSQGRIYSQQGPVQKKMRGPFNWGETLFFLKKTGDLFSNHRPCVSCQFSSKTVDLFLLITPVSLGGRPFFRRAKVFVGPLFVGAPVRPNMLNMPKSAAGDSTATSRSL